jgi:hypothetical protein
MGPFVQLIAPPLLKKFPVVTVKPRVITVLTKCKNFLVPTLSHMNTVYNVTISFISMKFNIILQSLPRSSIRSFHLNCFIEFFFFTVILSSLAILPPSYLQIFLTTTCSQRLPICLPPEMFCTRSKQLLRWVM